MLNNKETFNKVGISRNDEPTRFLTKEEMEQLEQASINYEAKIENEQKSTIEKNNRIKIEDIAPETKTKLTISKKTKNITDVIKNIIRKIFIIAIFIIVAILGFYLAFSWNMPINKANDEITKTKVEQQEELDNNKDENNIDDLTDKKEETFEVKVDKVKQLISELEENKDLKDDIVDIKNSTQKIINEHNNDINILKSKLENLINEYLK